MSLATGTDREALVRAVANEHLAEPGPLLPILHGVVDELGYVARRDVEVLAEMLNLSVAEVHGVVSFYHDLRTSPPPTHAIALCRAEACQAVGAEALFRDTTARARSGDLGEDVEVRQVFCFGNCALGPSGMVDGRLVGRLDVDRIHALTEAWRP